ncbi:MAG: energy transducer TonB [Verrucomicrobiales bacterium]|nr:energy transducer TonB [Verrucomicrobiales bacterium]
MSSPATAALSANTPNYELKSDLAQYCLPSANRDDSRKLAWANSVCLMFVVVATMGLRQPVFVIRDPPPPPEPLPVVILPPQEHEPQPETEKPEEQQEEPLDDLADVPVVAPVVVAAPQDVSFSVPVEGFVTISADARSVPPPPPVIPKIPPPDNIPRPEFKIIRFGDKTFKKQPPPNYPEEFQRNRISGTVEVLITVDTNGVPTKVSVGRSSGNSALDRHVVEFIQREWRTAAGEGGNFKIALTFAP